MNSRCISTDTLVYLTEYIFVSPIDLLLFGNGMAYPTHGNGRAGGGGYPQGDGKSLKVGREAGE